MLVALGAQLAALVEAYDRVLRDEQAMEAAAQSFSDLLDVSRPVWSPSKHSCAPHAHLALTARAPAQGLNAAA